MNYLLYWQTEDRKTSKKINQLINDITRNGNEGLGKPEPLSGNLAGYWSRRINDKEHMLLAKEENATKTYANLKEECLPLKALLMVAGVNLTEIDRIKE